MSRFILCQQSLPARLQSIPQPPHSLYVSSDNWDDLLSRPAVAIVGSRQPTSYGQSVTRRLASDLAAQGIVIISGLAFGVDSLAHQGALEAGGLSIAVLPAGLANIYPRSHHFLAKRILEQGGALVSEYDDDCRQPQRYQFVERNRLIAGFSQIVIITEADTKSGSRHTVDFASDQGRDVMAVPGAINNPLAAGPNQHIRDGAGVVLGYQDVLRALGISTSQQVRAQLKGNNPAETALLKLIAGGVSSSEDLQHLSQLPISQLNQSLTMLELTGRIRTIGPDRWSLV